MKSKEKSNKDEDKKRKVYSYREVLEQAVFKVLSKQDKEDNLIKSPLEKMNYDEIGNALNIEQNMELRRLINEEFKVLKKYWKQRKQYNQRSEPKPGKLFPVDDKDDLDIDLELAY